MTPAGIVRGRRWIFIVAMSPERAERSVGGMVAWKSCLNHPSAGECSQHCGPHSIQRLSLLRCAGYFHARRSRPSLAIF